MKTPHTNFRAETLLSGQEAAFLLDVIDEFREWICCKYGEEIQNFHRGDRRTESRGLVINEDDPF